MHTPDTFESQMSVSECPLQVVQLVGSWEPRACVFAFTSKQEPRLFEAHACQVCPQMACIVGFTLQNIIIPAHVCFRIIIYGVKTRYLELGRCRPSLTVTTQYLIIARSLSLTPLLTVISNDNSINV